MPNCSYDKSWSPDYMSMRILSLLMSHNIIFKYMCFLNYEFLTIFCDEEHVYNKYMHSKNIFIVDCTKTLNRTHTYSKI